MLKFKNKVLIIGYGSVSKCTIPILLKHIKIPYKNITIIDFVDMGHPALLRMWEKRQRGYKAMGYRIKEWPAIASHRIVDLKH